MASGRSAEDVAEALLIDPNRVRNHFRRYQQGGLPGLLHLAYRGSDRELGEAELAVLDAPGAACRLSGAACPVP